MSKKKHPEKNAPRTGTSLARLERLARQMTPVEWRRAVKRLADEIAEQASQSESKSHAECEDALPWYVSDEQRGENVRALYPAIWRHLRACGRCQQSYLFLSESLSAMESKTRPASSTTQPPLPFLQPVLHAPWFQQRPPRLLGGSPRIAFLLNAAHLHRLFSNISPLPLREAGRSEQALLLDDRVVIADQSLDVQAWLVPSPQVSDLFHIHLLIKSPVPLRTAMRAQLRWGTKEYTTYLSAGEATFEDISLPDFSRPYPDIPSNEFQLILEPITDASHSGD